MRWSKRSIAVLIAAGAVVLGIAAFVLVGRGDQPSPPRQGATSASVPPRISTIAVPVKIDLASLSERINADVPQVLHRVDQDVDNVCLPRPKIFGTERGPRVCAKGHIEGPIERNGPITVGGSGGTIMLGVPIKFSIQGRGRGEIAKHIHETAEGAATVFIRLTPAIDEDWTPRVAISTEFQWDNPAHIKILGITIPIRRHVDPKIEAQLEKLKAKAEAWLAENAKLRPTAEKAWQDLHRPIAINKTQPTWIVARPRAAYFAGFAVEGGAMTATFALDGEVQAIVAAAAPAPTPSALPKLAAVPAKAPAFEVDIPVFVEYSAASEFLTRVLSGKTYDLSGFERGATLTIRAAEVYPSEGKLVVRVRFAADLPSRRLGVNGDLFLIGQPRVDFAAKTVGLREWDFWQSSDAPGVDALVRSIREIIRPALQDKLAWSFAKAYDGVFAQAQQALNARRSEGVDLQGTIADVSIGGVQLLDRHIALIVSARGSVTLTYAPLRK